MRGGQQYPSSPLTYYLCLGGRLLSLRVLEPAKVARDWADLRAVAAQAPYKLRMAALSALHPRLALIQGCKAENILTSVSIYSQHCL